MRQSIFTLLIVIFNIYDILTVSIPDNKNVQLHVLLDQIPTYILYEVGDGFWNKSYLKIYSRQLYFFTIDISKHKADSSVKKLTLPNQPLIVCKFCLDETHMNLSQIDPFFSLTNSDELLDGFKRQLKQYKTKCSYANENIILLPFTAYEDNESFLNHLTPRNLKTGVY